MNIIVNLVVGIFSAITFVIMAAVMIVWQPIAWVIAKLMGIDTK